MIGAVFSQRFRNGSGICCLLIAITTIAYVPLLKCDFVNLDDPIYVTENSAVASGLCWNSIVYAWTTNDLGNWIPLTWLSFECDAALFGINATAFHVTNLVWHVLNVCLLYLVLYQMTGASGRSTVVAALFAVHPLHVESVAWVSERKDVLSTFWLLMTLLVYERYARHPTRLGMTCVGVTMVLGLLAKPMLVTLPILLLLVDIWPLRRLRIPAQCQIPDELYAARTGLQLLTEKLLLIFLSVADGLITIIIQRSEGAMEAWDQFPAYQRACYAIQGFGWYLWTTLYPSGLSVYYPFKPLSFPLVSLSALVLIAVSFYVVGYRDRRHLVVGWLWFVIALLPVSGLLQVGGQAHADRYAYIPHIGLFVAGVWEAEYWFVKWSAGRYLAMTAAVTTIALCMVLCSFQTIVWSNSETLWTHALELDPDNYAAHANLGVYKQGQRDFARAEFHLRRAVALRPAWVLAITNLGWLHVQRKEWEQAEESFAWALRVDPKSTTARNGLAQVRARRPAVSAPVRDGHQPDNDAIVSNRLGLKHARRGEFETALRHFREAIAIAPEYGHAHNNAALALGELKRPDEAETHFRLALKFDPDNRNFHVNLGALLESQRNWNEARKHYQIALRLNPNDVEAQQLLESLLKNSATHQ